MKSKLLGHSANDLFWFILPLVLPSLLIRYDLSYTQAGGILTTYLAVTAVCSFVMGKLSDRFSRRKILSYGFLLASLGLAASGFAPSLGIFLLIISFTGIGVSTFHPVMYAVIDENYPDNKGKVMGLYEGFGTGAILLMFLINGFLLDSIGVRGVLILTALPGLAMGLIYKYTDAIPPSKQHDADGTNGPSEAEKGEIARFVLFLTSVILRVMSVTAILNFLPTIFVSFLGYTESSAAFVTAFYFAGGIIGSLVAGKVSDRFNSFGILIVGTGLIVPSILIFSMDLPLWIYPVVICLFGCFGSGCIINQNLLMTRLGKHLGKGEVFGILMGVMTITSSLSPTLFGLIIDHQGFHKALLVLALPLLLSIVLLTLLLRSDRNRAGRISEAIPAAE